MRGAALLFVRKLTQHVRSAFRVRARSDRGVGIAGFELYGKMRVPPDNCRPVITMWPGGATDSDLSGILGCWTTALRSVIKGSLEKAAVHENAVEAVQGLLDARARSIDVASLELFPDRPRFALDVDATFRSMLDSSGEGLRAAIAEKLMVVLHHALDASNLRFVETSLDARPGHTSSRTRVDCRTEAVDLVLGLVKAMGCTHDCVGLHRQHLSDRLLSGACCCAAALPGRLSSHTLSLPELHAHARARNIV